MEEWLDFDYRQMPQIQNPMMGQMPWCQQQMMPYTPMQSQMQPQMQPSPAPAPEPSMQPTPAPNSNFSMEPGSPVQQDANYIQGYLRTQIGKSLRVEFLIGTSILTDRSGILVSVGIDHIVLVPFNSEDLQVCDLYSIKFVEIFGGAKDLPESLKAQAICK